MATRKRVLVVCPGRGSYGRNSLGQLKGRNAAATTVVAACDAFRLAQGRTACVGPTLQLGHLRVSLTKNLKRLHVLGIRTVTDLLWVKALA